MGSQKLLCQIAGLNSHLLSFTHSQSSGIFNTLQVVLIALSEMPLWLTELKAPTNNSAERTVKTGQEILKQDDISIYS